MAMFSFHLVTRLVRRFLPRFSGADDPSPSPDHPGARQASPPAGKAITPADDHLRHAAAVTGTGW